jgi:hypothetical protein
MTEPILQERCAAACTNAAASALRTEEIQASPVVALPIYRI